MKGVLLFLLALIFVFAANAQGYECKECQTVDGIKYECKDAQNASFCVPAFSCSNDSECSSAPFPCCSERGICERNYACSSDEDCQRYQGTGYRCANPGTCDSFCVPVIECEESYECGGQSFPCCSERGICEWGFECVFDSDCPKTDLAEYKCEMPNTCSAYCEIKEDFFESAKKRCKGDAFPSMESCLSSCLPPKNCYLNISESCFFCENAAPAPYNECKSAGMFASKAACISECVRSGGMCFFDRKVSCWQCVESRNDETACRKGEYKTPEECIASCGGMCYETPLTKCYKCIEGEEKRIEVRELKSAFSPKILEGRSIPYPFSVFFEGEKIILDVEREKEKYAMRIEDGKIKSMERGGFDDKTNFVIKIKNADVIESIILSNDTLKEFKNMISAGLLEIYPMDLLSFVRLLLLNIALAFS